MKKTKMPTQKLRVILILAIGVALLPTLGCEAPIDNGRVESAETQSDTKLVFSTLEIGSTNRGTIDINGYDRHFSVTFPTSYNSEVAYPVVLFFHGCMCFYSVWAFEVHHSAAKWGLLARIASPLNENGPGAFQTSSGSISPANLKNDPTNTFSQNCPGTFGVSFAIITGT